MSHQWLEKLITDVLNFLVWEPSHSKGLAPRENQAQQSHLWFRGMWRCQKMSRIFQTYLKKIRFRISWVWQSQQHVEKQWLVSKCELLLKFAGKQECRMKYIVYCSNGHVFSVALGNSDRKIGKNAPVLWAEWFLWLSWTCPKTRVFLADSKAT